MERSAIRGRRSNSDRPPCRGGATSLVIAMAVHGIALLRSPAFRAFSACHRMLSVTMWHSHGSGRSRRRTRLLTCTNILFLLAAVISSARAQTAAVAEPAQPPASQPVSITLEEAIHRAQANEPSYATAVADSRSAALDRSIARSALLPGVTYHHQYLYTQPNGVLSQASQGTASQPPPRFIANNTVHEYMSQRIVDETIGVAQVAGLRYASAAAALAAAQLKIARRGLVATVTSLYYGAIASDHKLAIAERARAEAADFTGLTGKREQQRESAHADVVKAQLQQQQRDRDLSDARLPAEKARLELGVLLFPDPRTPYALAVTESSPQLASRTDATQ